MNNMLNNDIEKIQEMNLPLELLKNKKILVTGATGLIGSMLCRTLSELGVKNNWNIAVYAMARNKEKAKKMLNDVDHNGNIVYWERNLTEPFIEEHVDYIIHTACPTASNTFISKPVETIQAIVTGTMNVLELAKKTQCDSVVYLSSMEAYGQILHENELKPEEVGYINPLSLRSCYPEGKRIAENLCISYFSEYQVPVKIVRLAQTFGPGIPSDDGRVFAQFIRSAINEKDIVMFTEGGSKRMYLDTMDAVSAILAIMLKGKDGEVYNAGNKDTYSSIKEMAEFVIREFGNGKCKLVIDRSKDVGQYPPDNMLKLDVKPLMELGWHAHYDLKDMYKRMIEKN